MSLKFLRVLVLSTLLASFSSIQPIASSLSLTNFLNSKSASPSQSRSLKFEKKNLQFNYETEKVYGVNLGGWFVLEPYITPSLFNVFDASDIPVDEYHYTQYLGKEVAEDRLIQHWTNWITESDFANMKNYGLNFVRIPIGYWAFQLLDGDPYVQGQEAYLDQALDWCKTYGLYAWIDLHGAPGSQNGFDNSGQRDVYQWQSGNNVNVTLSVLNYIMTKYGGSNYEDVVIGIELVNEPLGPILNMDEVHDFYIDGYNQLRNTGSDQAVIIHDAFQAMGYWDSFMLLNDYWNVVVDHHHYQVFSAAELSTTLDAKIEVACQWGSDAAKEYHWSVSGEWSAALTDCAPWLNGVGTLSRFEGQFDSSPYIGNCSEYLEVSNWSQDTRANYRKFIEAQLDAFELNSGWVFWCWKTEDAIEWDFQRLVVSDIFPQPLSARTYPGQCDSYT